MRCQTYEYPLRDEGPYVPRFLNLDTGRCDEQKSFSQYRQQEIGRTAVRLKRVDTITVRDKSGAERDHIPCW